MYCLQKQAEKIYTCTDFDEKDSKKMLKVGMREKFQRRISSLS